MSEHRTDWHSAFFQALCQDLNEYNDILEYEANHPLTSMPFEETPINSLPPSALLLSRLEVAKLLVILLVSLRFLQLPATKLAAHLAASS
jgi:hypothetical protein